ncbi:pilus assembly protein [Kosakonia radicincitans]|uniref:type 4b pilus protein PilO2 n=1 Tax=Kosakonia radicincitans TaxID=283686 RepID=UPI0011EEA4D7|nr:type 4b pilus protein PilO2 [Kosakonia radicincitans]QEM89816.1 pilus assembly protein [Kosakonia radicincitans]
MSLQKKTTRRTGIRLTHHRRDWMAGLHWAPQHSALRVRLRGRASPDTHCVTAGRGSASMAGVVSPGRVRHRLYALAVAFQLSEGGNAWGIYRLSRDEDLWVFFAASGGQLSVMGDVTGTRAFIESAAQNFLRFNDADAPGLRCAATAEDGRDATTLTDRLSGAQLRHCRLRKRLTPLSLILPAVVMTFAVASGTYWYDVASQKAEQAAAAAAFRARMAMTPETKVAPARAPHPWASQPPVSLLLSNCWLTREPLYASVAGWRFSDGECVPEGLRERFIATPGATVEDFARRVKELFGLSAVFNLSEGGKNGDIFIPFRKYRAGEYTDEVLPGADAQLMRFISHLQRRNLDVKFTEVKPPAVAPGQEKNTPVQDWREFTFSVSSRLQPELLMQDFDATGLRLTSVSITMSPKGQYAYTIKGSIYAQN